MKKKHYTQPCFLKIVTVQLERSFLEGSVNKNMKVDTTPQEVKAYDFSNQGGGTEFSGQGFNSIWE